jgi:serine phosphatase RsbU (regulator of sigma subunit)
LLYTDGVTEAGLPYMEPWGEANLINHLKEIHHRSTTEILESILAKIEKSTEGIEQTDDITMILLKRN